MIIYYDGPCANKKVAVLDDNGEPKLDDNGEPMMKREFEKIDDIGYSERAENSVYSDAYLTQDFLNGAIRQIRVPMETTGDEVYDIGANPSAEADDCEEHDVHIQQSLSLLNGYCNLDDMTEMYTDTKAAKKEYQAYLKKVLAVYIKEVQPEKMKKFGADANIFMKQLFNKIDGQSPRFENARIIRNACFDSDGTIIGAWMFVFDNDENPENPEKRKPYNSKFRYVWILNHGLHEEKC